MSNREYRYIVIIIAVLIFALIIAVRTVEIQAKPEKVTPASYNLEKNAVALAQYRQMCEMGYPGYFRVGRDFAYRDKKLGAGLSIGVGEAQVGRQVAGGSTLAAGMGFVCNGWPMPFDAQPATVVEEEER